MRVLGVTDSLETILYKKMLEMKKSGDWLGLDDIYYCLVPRIMYKDFLDRMFIREGYLMTRSNPDFFIEYGGFTLIESQLSKIMFMVEI